MKVQVMWKYVFHFPLSHWDIHFWPYRAFQVENQLAHLHCSAGSPQSLSKSPFMADAPYNAFSVFTDKELHSLILFSVPFTNNLCRMNSTPAVMPEGVRNADFLSARDNFPYRIVT